MDDDNEPVFIGGSYIYPNGDTISEGDAIEGLSTMYEDPVEQTVIIPKDRT